MATPIIVKYLWTVEEMEAAKRFQMRNTYSFWSRRIGVVLVSLVLLAGLGGKVLTSDHTTRGVPILVLCSAYLALTFFGFKWIARRTFKKRPDYGKLVEWNIFHDRILVDNGLVKSELKWDALVKVVRTKSGFLFYPNHQIFHWLPRHGFVDPTGFDSLAELAGARVREFNDQA